MQEFSRLGFWLFFPFLGVISACFDRTTMDGASSIKLEAEPYVVVISIDGYRSDYTDRFKPPTLSRLRKQGVSTENLVPVFPPNLFPVHYSIATGLFPDEHGIVDNSFYDSVRNLEFARKTSNTVQDASWFGGVPIWTLLEGRDIPTAVYFWPGSEALIEGRRPTYVPTFEKTSSKDRLDQIPSLLVLSAEKRPHLIMTVVSDVDWAGHEFGPNSEEVKQAVLKVDQEIERLLTKLDKLKLPLNVVILSPYGMEQVDQVKVEFLEDYVDLSKVRVIGSGSTLHLYSTDKKALENSLSQLKTKSKHFNVYRREDLPARFHYSGSPRCGDLIVVAQAPYSVMPAKPKPNDRKMHKGSHGYDPNLTQGMRGMLYATGPHFKSRHKVESFKAVSIYSLLLRIFGIPVPGGLVSSPEESRVLLRVDP